MVSSVAIFTSLFLPFATHGHQALPEWNAVVGKPLQFFRERGFEFSVDDVMSRHYKKPTVEISILLPERFIEAGRTNEFEGIELQSEELSTSVGTHPHSGKKRAIITLSQAMIRKLKVSVRYRNQRPGPPHGSVYALDLTQVLDDWKRHKVRKADKTDR